MLININVIYENVITGKKSRILKSSQLEAVFLPPLFIQIGTRAFLRVGKETFQHNTWLGHPPGAGKFGNLRS